MSTTPPPPPPFQPPPPPPPSSGSTPPSGQPGRPVEVRMSAAKMRHLGLRFAAGLAVALLVALVPNRRTEDWGTLGKVGLVAVVVVVIVVVAALLPVRFVVDHRGLTVRRLVGLTRTIEWARIASGVYVEDFQAAGRGGVQSSSRVFLRDPAGRTVLRLSSQSAGRDELSRLVTALGRQRFEHVPGPVDAKTLAASHPGLLSFLERRPVLVGVVAALVIVAAVVVGVLLFADY